MVIIIIKLNMFFGKIGCNGLEECDIITSVVGRYSKNLYKRLF